jgi:hypothetical protein
MGMLKQLLLMPRQVRWMFFNHPGVRPVLKTLPPY